MARLLRISALSSQADVVVRIGNAKIGGTLSSWSYNTELATTQEHWLFLGFLPTFVKVLRITCWMRESLQHLALLSDTLG